MNTYGKGRVYVNALGHDRRSHGRPQLRAWLRGRDLGRDGDVNPRFDPPGAARLSARFLHAFDGFTVQVQSA